MGLEAAMKGSQGGGVFTRWRWWWWGLDKNPGSVPTTTNRRGGAGGRLKMWEKGLPRTGDHQWGQWGTLGSL